MDASAASQPTACSDRIELRHAFRAPSRMRANCVRAGTGNHGCVDAFRVVVNRVPASRRSASDSLPALARRHMRSAGRAGEPVPSAGSTVARPLTPAPSRVRHRQGGQGGRGRAVPVYDGHRPRSNTAPPPGHPPPAPGTTTRTPPRTAVYGSSTLSARPAANRLRSSATISRTGDRRSARPMRSASGNRRTSRPLADPRRVGRRRPAERPYRAMQPPRHRAAGQPDPMPRRRGRSARRKSSRRPITRLTT